VKVTDNGVPQSSDTKSFTVVVNDKSSSVVVVSPPILASIVASSGSVTISWSAVAGTRYRVQFKSALNDPSWSDLPEDVTSAGTTAAKTDSMLSETQRSYRVLLVP
jgi:hypothetical protein